MQTEVYVPYGSDPTDPSNWSWSITPLAKQLSSTLSYKWITEEEKVDAAIEEIEKGLPVTGTFNLNDSIVVGESSDGTFFAIQSVFLNPTQEGGMICA